MQKARGRPRSIRRWGWWETLRGVGRSEGRRDWRRWRKRRGGEEKDSLGGAAWMLNGAEGRGSRLPPVDLACLLASSPAALPSRSEGVCLCVSVLPLLPNL